jgi:hypothetical protein
MLTEKIQIQIKDITEQCTAANPLQNPTRNPRRSGYAAVRAFCKIKKKTPCFDLTKGSEIEKMKS